MGSHTTTQEDYPVGAKIQHSNLSGTLIAEIVQSDPCSPTYLVEILASTYADYQPGARHYFSKDTTHNFYHKYVPAGAVQYTCPVPVSDIEPINRRNYYIGQLLCKMSASDALLVRVKETHFDYIAGEVVRSSILPKGKPVNVCKATLANMKEVVELYHDTSSAPPALTKQQMVQADLEKLRQILKELKTLHDKARDMRDKLFPVGQQVTCLSLFNTKVVGSVGYHLPNPWLLSVKTKTSTGTWGIECCTPID